MNRRFFLKGIFLNCCFLFLSTATTWAIQAVMTHNIFHAPDGNGLKPYVEVYWEIDPNTLLFDKKDDVWKGRIKTDIIIAKGNMIVAQEHYILETKPASDVKAVLSQRIMDLRRFSLDTGDYKLDVILTDEVKKGGEYKYMEYIHIPSTQEPFFSDIQLIDTIIPSKEENIFQRNNHIQIPLSTNFLDENRKRIKFYAELYNTSHAPAAKEIKLFISKKENGSAIFGLSKTINTQHALLEIVHDQFGIAVLSSGNYYLNMQLTDGEDKVLTTKNLFFQVVNEKPVAYKVEKDTTKSTTTGDTKSQPTYVNLNKTYLSKYTPEQIRAILKMLIPIANPTERNNINEFLKRPDDMYSRYFIYNFWLSRGNINAEDEWKTYAEQVKKVNKLFGTAMVRGYESDRGMMYLKYGEPTERVRVENEEGAHPYEVWQYNTLLGQANVLFLFFRPGFVGSDYRLLTSTATGEIVNKNWRRDLYTVGRSTSNNSRAEQYFLNR